MNEIQDVLQVSAKLYAYLAEIPSSEHRDQYIEEIHRKLDERSQVITALQQAGFQYDELSKTHKMLVDLDKGIQERLQFVMEAIKLDLKDLQNTKKNESQYRNPYASVQVMDGRYYDRKK